MLFRKVDKELKKKIEALGEWYYYINFDGIEVRRDLKKDETNGFANWNGYLQYCLPGIEGKRILDIGCNAGVYDLEISRAKAAQTVGVDLNTAQAEFVKEWFSRKEKRDFGNVRFIKRDAAKDGLSDLGRFDFVCLFAVVYHFREKIDSVMGEVSRITDTVVLQGNLKRLSSNKYKDRVGTEYAGITGMKDLLKRHGFKKFHVFAMNNYPKPVVIGER